MGFPLIEPVEVLKSQAGWPAVEGPGGADVGLGRIVPLPEHGRRVAIATQDFRDEGGTARNDARVAGIPRAHLNNHPRTNAVVIAAGEQRCAGGTAKSCRVETSIGQTVDRQLLQVGRLDRTTQR